MTTIQDVMKFLDSLNNPTQPLGTERVITALLVTIAVALMIFVFYRLTFKGVLYTRNYNVGLVMTSMVTTLIILPITSNVLLALGMVGALSIIRFRTPIKDPMDLVFMFWAIAVGVSCGAGFYMVSLVGSPIIGLFILAFSWVSKIPGTEPYILVVHYNSQADEKVRKALPSHRVRSRTVTASGVELIAEVRLKSQETTKVDKLLKIDGVKDSSLVSYSGDYIS
jgi:uncharacterized membrane protein YhiD involved in acid resistance